MVWHPGYGEDEQKHPKQQSAAGEIAGNDPNTEARWKETLREPSPGRARSPVRAGQGPGFFNDINMQEVLRREALDNRGKLDVLGTARLESLKCPNSKCPLRSYNFSEEERKIRTGLLVRQTVIEELVNDMGVRVATTLAPDPLLWCCVIGADIVPTPGQVLLADRDDARSMVDELQRQLTEQRLEWEQDVGTLQGVLRGERDACRDEVSVVNQEKAALELALYDRGQANEALQRDVDSFARRRAALEAELQQAHDRVHALELEREEAHRMAHTAEMRAHEAETAARHHTAEAVTLREDVARLQGAVGEAEMAREAVEQHRHKVELAHDKIEAEAAAEHECHNYRVRCSSPPVGTPAHAEHIAAATLGSEEIEGRRVQAHLDLDEAASQAEATILQPRPAPGLPPVPLASPPPRAEGATPVPLVPVPTPLVLRDARKDPETVTWQMYLRNSPPRPRTRSPARSPPPGPTAPGPRPLSPPPTRSPPLAGTLGLVPPAVPLMEPLEHKWPALNIGKRPRSASRGPTPRAATSEVPSESLGSPVANQANPPPCPSACPQGSLRTRGALGETCCSLAVSLLPI